MALILTGCQPGERAARLADGPVAPRAPSRSHAPRQESVAEPLNGTWRVFGRSNAGRDLQLFEIAGHAPATLILGGIHGSEPESAAVAERLAALLAETPTIAEGRRVLIAPAVNPDGLRARRRTNGRAVDLNRNFPASNWSSARRGSRYDPGPSPASEPETRAIIDLITETRPDRIVSIHSVSGGRHCNNYDGPAAFLAEAMSEHNGYPPTATWSSPTPGSLGSWAGRDAGIPILTLELPARTDPDLLWHQNRAALLAAILVDDQSTGR